MVDFDDAERRIWAGRAAAFRDSFAKLCAHTAPALLDAVGAGPDTRLLDVGTGIGTVAAAAGALGAKVTAVDAEPGMIELARHTAPQAEFRVAVLPDLPFDADSFDAVVANFVVNHVGRPTAVVAAMRAVARPSVASPRRSGAARPVPGMNCSSGPWKQPVCRNQLIRLGSTRPRTSAHPGGLRRPVRQGRTRARVLRPGGLGPHRHA